MNLKIHRNNFSVGLSDKEIRSVGTFVAATLNLSGSTRIILVDDVVMSDLHKRFLNDPERTDVMTFNLADDGDIEGEIYISHPQMQRQADSYHVHADEELLRLIIHGMLHLAGFDDRAPREYRLMKREEERILQKVRENFPQIAQHL